VIGRSDSPDCDLNIVDGEVSFFLKLSILFGVPGPSPSSCLVLNIDLNLLDLGESSLFWSSLPTSIDNRLGLLPSTSVLGFPFSDPLLIREIIEGIV
jgi:hypothetical protein